MSSLTLKAKLFSVTAASALLLTACGGSATDQAGDATTTTMSAMDHSQNIKTAGDLRNNMNLLLGEHLVLASKATGAALNGNNAEFEAYGEKLNANGTEIGKIFGAAAGGDAETQFNSIWSAHNGFFVDYTQGVAAKDSAKQAKAVSDLTTVYVPQFSKLVSDATGLPLATVTGLVEEHVVSTKEIVDAQGAKDWAAAYAATGEAYGHMQMIGDPVAKAVAGAKADMYPTQQTEAANNLRVSLNQLLQEHLYLATFATDAALAGRTAEFTAAGNALNTNGTEIGAAVGSIYGTEAQTQFNSIWSAHNGFFVDYTQAVAAKDEAAKNKAVSDLTTVYVPQFTEFLVGATGLPEATVTQLVTEHVTHTAAVVDAQAAGNWDSVADEDVEAARHMQTLGDPLAKAIVAKFPEKFA